MLANLGEFRQSNVPQGVADYVTNQLDSIKKLMFSYDDSADFHSFPIKKEKMMKLSLMKLNMLVISYLGMK